MPKLFFYAVRVGVDGPAIYTTEDECTQATAGYPPASSKKFRYITDAQQWLSEGMRSPLQERRVDPKIGSSSSARSLPRTFKSERSEVIYLLSDDDMYDAAVCVPPVVKRHVVKQEVAAVKQEVVEVVDDSDTEDMIAVPEVPVAPPPADPGRPVDNSLSPEQQHILDKVLEGRSLFFTGSAGTGKSFLLGSIIKQLRYRDGLNTVAVTAPTGIAAVNIGGGTLHSWAGIGLGKEKKEKLLQKVGGFARKRWMTTETLIIDEVSMLDGVLLDKLDYIGRTVRGDQSPFGGIQLVLCGDFFQLPPVPDEYQNAKVPITFAFEAECWKQAVPLCFTLTHVFRQKEQQFVDMLNDARLGELKPAGIRAFYMLDRPLSFDDGIDPVQLFPKRDQVRLANDLKLAALSTQPYVYVALDQPGIDHKGHPISLEEAKRKLEKNCPAPASITLKVGCQVMCVMTVENGLLVNGTMGTVKAFMTPPQAIQNGYSIPRPQEPKAKDEDTPAGRARQRERLERKKREEEELAKREWPLIAFQNGMTVLMEPIPITVVNVFGDIEASRTQLPLILAWALSIHKSQGQTLQRVKVDLSEVFERGQAYVALSRATTLEGLWVTGFKPEKVMAHPRVIEWSKTLQTGPAGIQPAR